MKSLKAKNSGSSATVYVHDHAPRLRETAVGMQPNADSAQREECI
jgi:hypothetical protein